MPDLEEGEKAVCPRCVAPLLSNPRNSLHRTAAFAFASGLLFIVANAFPFMTLEAGYRHSEMRLWQSAWGLEAQGYPYLAGAVSFFILGAPALLIGGLLYLLLPLLWNTPPAGRGPDLPLGPLGAALEHDRGLPSRRTR